MFAAGDLQSPSNDGALNKNHDLIGAAGLPTGSGLPYLGSVMPTIPPVSSDSASSKGRPSMKANSSLAVPVASAALGVNNINVINSPSAADISAVSNVVSEKPSSRKKSARDSEEEEENDSDEDDEVMGGRKKKIKAVPEPCPRCGIQLGSRAALKYHVKQAVCQKRAQRRGTGVLPDSETSAVEDSLNIGMADESVRSEPCEKCGKTFSSKHGLKYHMENGVCDKKRSRHIPGQSPVRDESENEAERRIEDQQGGVYNHSTEQQV